MTIIRTITAVGCFCVTTVASAAAMNVAIGTGYVQPSCNFTTSVPGVLGVAEGNQALTTDPAYGGIRPRLGIAYIGYPTLEVAAPTLTMLPRDQEAPFSTTARMGPTVFIPQGAASTGFTKDYSAGTSDQIEVDLTAYFNSKLKNGLYQLTSIVTCG